MIKGDDEAGDDYRKISKRVYMCRVGIIGWFWGIKKPPTQEVRGVDSINMAATYSPALWCSTIGHEGLNYSVRYGKR